MLMPPSMNSLTCGPVWPVLAVKDQGVVMAFWLVVAQRLSFAATGGTDGPFFLTGGAEVQDARVAVPPPIRSRWVDALPPESTHSKTLTVGAAPPIRKSLTMRMSP